MAYNSSNVLPPAQNALNNAMASSYPYGTPVPGSITTSSSQPLATSTVTKQPVPGSVTSIGSTPNAGLATPPKPPVAPPTYIPPNAGFGTGIARTPADLLAQDPTRADPTANSQSSATSPNALNTSSFPGLITSLLGTAKGYYDTQQGLTQQSQDIAGKFAGQEANLVQGFNGIGADATNARIQQLEQFKNSAISAIEGEQAKQASYLQPLTTLGQTAIGATQPQLSDYGKTFYQPLQAGQSQGGQFGSGPAAAANVQSVKDQTTAINDYSAARASAQNLTTQLNSLITSKGINPSDLNAVNRFIQGIMGQTSSPEYQTFSNLVQDLAARYAQVLTPAGGDTTNMVRSIAQSLINATASGQSIQTVLQSLDSQAQAVIAGYQNNVNNLSTGQNVNPAPTQNNASSTNLFSW